MPAAIRPDRLLRDLAELWVTLGKEGESAGGVLRACALTLVAIATPEDDPTEVGETLAGLMRHHPSRAIVVRLDPGQAELSARVYAQCWLPFGGRRQICCEQIEIQAPPAGLADAAAAVVPLIAADLPVELWARNPDLLGQAGFRSWLSLGGRIITDSARAAAPDATLRRIRSLLNAGSPVADLAWTRITRWRELIAQIFENPRYLVGVPSLTELEIWHAGSSPHPSARYLAAWIAAGGETLGGKPACTFHPGPAESSVSRITMRGAGMEVSLEKVDTTLVEVRVNGLRNCTVLQPSSDCALLDEELGLAAPDRTFLAALDRVCADPS